MIALIGAHRVGKSTLARRFAEATGVTYLPSRASETFATFGFKVGQTLTPEDRLDVQDAILNNHLADLRQYSPATALVSDRSPLDFAAYVLCELTGCSEATQQRAFDYVDRCIWETNRHWAVVMLIQPGIPYVVEEGKPPADLLAQQRMNLTLMGMLFDARITCRCGVMPRVVVDLDDRMECLMADQARYARSLLRDARNDEVRH